MSDQGAEHVEFLYVVGLISGKEIVVRLPPGVGTRNFFHLNEGVQFLTPDGVPGALNRSNVEYIREYNGR